MGFLTTIRRKARITARRAQASFTTQAKSLVVAGVTIGAGILALVGFMDANSSSAEVNTTLNGFVSGIGGFQTWVPVVVTMIAVAVILGLVNKFGGGKKR